MDAASIAMEHNRKISPPSKREVREEYYKRKTELDEITQYPQKDIQEILKAVPETIRKRKRYSAIFK